MRIEEIIYNPIIQKNGVHFLADHSQFAYSDGDRTENYILDVIGRAKDISSGSRELEAYIRDWPTLYHLSRERSLAFQPLNITRSCTIIEVGCGCGSITRLFGERCDHVLALEGSARRAAITRTRTRDLDSVQVLCASFEEVEFKKRFDLVVCNGVLEYAALFVKHERPYERMIELFSQLVAPSGSLIIAIENKLGLRYFSSGKEEHTGVMFDGLEGYAGKPSGPRTFGVRELHELLATRFSAVEVLLPLPDYKLPTAVVHERLIRRVNCAELFANTAKHDFGSCVSPRMHERLVWHELQKNGLLKEFANSFFMIAGDAESSLLNRQWMGSIYSVRRRPAFTVKTEIQVDATDSIFVVKHHLEPQEYEIQAELVQHRLETVRWSEGITTHTQVVRTLVRRGHLSLVERLRAPVEVWWHGVKKSGLLNGNLGGDTLDFHWQNSFVESDQAALIDGEWNWNNEIDPSWLICRTVMKFVRDELPFAHRWCKECRNVSPFQLMQAVGQIAGVAITIGSVWRSIKNELSFQMVVSGHRHSEAKAMALVFEPIRARAIRKAALNHFRMIVAKLRFVFK